MILDRTTGDPFYRKALRTSMGAALQMPFVRIADWTGALGALRGKGWMVAALTPRGDAEPLDPAAARLAASPARLLLVGSEGAGLSDESLALADLRLRIPMSGHRVDSLNVVVAAGIALARLGE
jgi:tRNA G18 (ribose-2'-O)-methylase SpoU